MQRFSSVRFHIELDRETDGRWIAEIVSLPGVTAYGKTKHEAVAKVEELALRVVADRIKESKTPLRRSELSFACK
jgi:predicted RNase H-like HicB family nuclease